MDIWRCGFVAQPIESLLAGWPAGSTVHWLPEQPPGQFLADPFGWHKGSALHVFAERYDYRTRHGVIDRLSFDTSGHLLEAGTVLRESWHLSYPLVFEGEGAMWMLPEACRSAGLTLYRGDDTLTRWTAEVRIELDRVPIDATVVWYAGTLVVVLFGCRVARDSNGTSACAWAQSLTGPWHAHARNPVRVDQGGARPAGRAVVVGERLMLPVQDCTSTYGGAVRPLWIECLNEHEFIATLAKPLALPPDHGVYRHGMHTLSAAGDWTLFDVKRVDRLAGGLLYGLQHWLRPSG